MKLQLTAIIPLLVAFTVFTVYWVSIWIKYGIQSSISDSFYRLPDSKKYLFVLTLFTCGMTLAIVGSELTPHGTPLMFFGGSLFCLVGVAPLFKRKIDHIVHMIGAYSGFVLGIAALFYNFHEYVIASLSAAIIVILFFSKMKNKIWWVEVAGACGLLLGLLSYALGW